MGAPQVAIIVLYTLSVGLVWARHGMPRKGNHNVFMSLISCAIVAGILWWGGWWS